MLDKDIQKEMKKNALRIGVPDSADRMFRVMKQLTKKKQ
jgi:hypothetical protein